ncbi:hypothetical protein MZM54_00050 [[Brevibacterium] frigoritolerans]|nr:hypothetical protein [Peribacillus frigoritolerans]
MVYSNEEVIEKETIEQLATVCVETGSPAEVGIDWCNEDNADYYTIWIDLERRLTFYNDDRAESVAKDINNYAAEIIKRGEVPPRNNKQQESNLFAEINYFNNFDDKLPI